MVTETKEKPAGALQLTEWQWETPLGMVTLSVEIVRKYFCQKANDGEIMHFLAVCKYHQLNPWLRDAYLVKYTDDEAAQIVIGKDTHAKRAEEHPQYAGDVGGIIVKLPDGKVELRVGEFFLEPEELVGGWADVVRKDREKPIQARVKLKDWVQTKRDGTPAKFWRLTPAHMIAKVAMAHARHEAFPAKYQGTISEHELNTGPGRAVDITPTITEPLSVDEAARQAAGGNGTVQAPPAAEAPAGPAASAETVATGPAEPDAKEKEQIRAQEQAEAAGKTEPPKATGPKPDRQQIWTGVLGWAKKHGKKQGMALSELAGRQVAGMSELSDEEVLAIAAKLKG